MENPSSTCSLRRIAFYPCCANDIEEPRRLLAHLVDEIWFCDIKMSAIRTRVRDEPGLPKAIFLHGDVHGLIPDLPLLTVLFYRNDSTGEGGSRIPLLGKVWLREIMKRFDPAGGWIISDGSNGAKTFNMLLSENWHHKPSWGFKFRKASGFEVSNNHGRPLKVIEVKPMRITKPTTRPGWVPPVLDCSS